LRNTGIGKIKESDRFASANQRMAKHREIEGMAIWMELQDKHRKVPQSYVNEYKEKDGVVVQSYGTEA
jgi:hypothetical protein